MRLATARVGRPEDANRPRAQEDVLGDLVESLNKEGNGDLRALSDAAQGYFDHAYEAYRRKRGSGRSLVWRFR